MDDYQRFWLSTVKQVDEFLLRRVRKGQRFRLATSAGGRPVWAVQYGLPGRDEAHTNFSAALGAGEFDTFWGAHDLEHPIVVIVCGTHGAEMEGVVGAINLLSILETGHDLRDRPWPKIVSLA